MPLSSWQENKTEETESHNSSEVASLELRPSKVVSAGTRRRFFLKASDPLPHVNLLRGNQVKKEEIQPRKHLKVGTWVGASRGSGSSPRPLSTPPSSPHPSLPPPRFLTFAMFSLPLWWSEVVVLGERSAEWPWGHQQTGAPLPAPGGRPAPWSD